MTVKIGRLVELGSMRGAPVEIGGRRLVPIAWGVSLFLTRSGAPPCASFVWTRAVAVEVRDRGGSRRVPIADVGGRIALVLVALAAVPILVDRLRGRRRPSG